MTKKLWLRVPNFEHWRLFRISNFEFRILTLLLALPLFVSGCSRSSTPSVVLYTSVDDPIARPIIDDFTKQTGIHVTLVTDTEASKSVGLAERLRAEKDHPQADVWWGNEPFHTINLAEEGLLAPYDSPTAKEIAEPFKDPQHRWTSNGLRVRVIGERYLLITTATPAPLGVQNVEDFARPDLKGKIAMARPTAGTTGGQVAALYAVWGEQKADRFFQSLRANDIKLLGGNSVVAQEVAHGTVALGLTDNDDVASEQAEGLKEASIRAILPDQKGMGTLAVPTTIGLVNGAKNPEPAKKLIDFLLSKETEQTLIDVKFAMFSARADAKSDAKFMQVDYPAVAKNMASSVRRATVILEGRE
jgi:iron(III) transport system substrate-binding protein